SHAGQPHRFDAKLTSRLPGSVPERRSNNPNLLPVPERSIRAHKQLDLAKAILEEQHHGFEGRFLIRTVSLDNEHRADRCRKSQYAENGFCVGVCIRVAAAERDTAPEL